MFNRKNKDVNNLANQEENTNFLLGALAWHGSVTPRVLLSVLITGLYTLGLAWIDIHYYKLPGFAVTPFEYIGAVLGLVLVFRTNAGHDRWWEARKLWGAIVNQSRNLLVMSWNYGADDKQWCNDMTKWIVAFSFAAKESLRLQKEFDDLKAILNDSEIIELRNAPHSPVFVSGKIAALLQQARLNSTIDGFVFLEIEKQRAALIDSIGGCERILKTPMPLVYAIKARRFILIYLLLLPLSLIDEVGLMAVPIAILVAYPLFSLDRIGIELQNPFATKNLSHLPLQSICVGIKNIAATFNINKMAR
ncbi:bestrophin family protein [Methylobacter sp.]|nr:bestrophin family ion channel [Methylobacter sp.]